MKFSIRTLIWIVVLLGVIIAGALAMIPKPVAVDVAAATEGSLRVSVEEDGKTRIREKYIVSAPVSGRLSRIELKAGDEIGGDQTLLAVILPSEPAMLDARSRAEAKARVQAAQAAVERSKAAAEQANINFELAETKFDRAERLSNENAISRNEYDIARSQYLASLQASETAKFDGEIATFELEMAKAAISQFADTKDDSTSEPFEIHAPVRGKVLRVFQESASVVAVGTPLVELGDPRNLEIEIDVLSTDAVRIKAGAELTIDHWGGESPLRGNVRVIEPAAFTKVSSLGVEEQRVNIIADFSETGDRLATLGDGYRVEARITIEQLDNVLLVPNSALFRYQREWHVFIIADGQASMKKITIGRQNETHTQIVEGLSANDQVIVYPSDEIQEGTKIVTTRTAP